MGALTGGGLLPGFRRDASAVRGRHFERALIARVLRHARPYWRRMAIFLVTVIGVAAVSTVTPLLFKALLDTAIPRRDQGLVTWLGLAALGLAIAESVLRLTQRWYSARIGEGLIRDLRVELFDHVQRMPVQFFTHAQTGALMSRLNNDVIGAQRAVTTTLGSLTQNAFVLLFAIPVMLTLEWRLTVGMLAIVPVFLVIARRIGFRLQDAARATMQQNAAMNATMSERFNVSGALLVKVFGSYARERRAFADRADEVRELGVRQAVITQQLIVALSLVVAIGTVTVFWFGGRLAASGEMTVGEVAAFSVYVARVYQPLIQLTNARVELLTSLVSFERVFEVLDLPHRVADRPDSRPLPVPASGRIELRDVHFGYPAPADATLASLDEAATLSPRAAGDVLRGVSFTVQPGETVALVGPSGAGKSTIASLVSRLYDVGSGELLVDGHDVRSLTQESLRSVIAVVPQDPHLFHDTVAANLRYARPDATDAELVETCRRARIHDVIAGLPDGYETVVGERGHRFSGGEKQRLAIARAMLKRPAIVILDEATAHLDSETESLIQQALSEALEGRTAVVIAHRLSTIVAADRIVVIDAGTVVDQGTHDELLARGGLYADLYRTQYGTGPQPEAFFAAAPTPRAARDAKNGGGEGAQPPKAAIEVIGRSGGEAPSEPSKS
jgi:ATP-binding cassette, subfamily B, bacterial